PAEAEPQEEEHEANHQPDRAPAVGFLLLKEVECGFVAHILTLGRPRCDPEWEAGGAIWRDRPAAPPAPPDPRAPTARPVAPSRGPPPGWSGTAAASCCTACRYRCRAAGRRRCDSPSTSAPPGAGRRCRSPSGPGSARS